MHCIRAKKEWSALRIANLLIRRSFNDRLLLDWSKHSCVCIRYYDNSLNVICLPTNSLMEKVSRQLLLINGMESGRTCKILMINTGLTSLL